MACKLMLLALYGIHALQQDSVAIRAVRAHMVARELAETPVMRPPNGIANECNKAAVASKTGTSEGSVDKPPTIRVGSWNVHRLNHDSFASGVPLSACHVLF